MKKLVFALLACATILTACDPTVLVSEIKLSKTSASIIEGESLKINAIVSPAEAENKELAWSSSNPAVATVDQAGLVAAIAEGTATITAAATDGGGATAKCEITVTKKAILVDKIELNKYDYRLKPGETYQLEAVVSPDDATTQAVEWKSSSTAVATVDATGKVTAVAVGTANITASATDGSGKVSNPCVITVAEPQPLFVKFKDMVIRVGQKYTQVVCYGTVDDYANREDADPADLIVKSDNESVAKITADDAVVIEGMGPGKTQVTISDKNGSSVTIPVEVLAKADIPSTYNYGIELFDARSLDNWITHGDLTLDAGFVEGTQCVWNKNFHREDSESGNAKAAYLLFAYKLPKGGVDIRDIQNPALYIRLYVNKPEVLRLDGANAQIELTSGRDMDNEELTWTCGSVFTNWTGGSPEAKMELKSGWNNIVLPLDYIQGQIGEFRPKTVNYFRFYNNPGSEFGVAPGNPYDLTGKGLEMAIDMIRIVDWTEFDTCDNFDTWYDGGTGNNRPCYRFEEEADGHKGVFLSKDELITGPISNFRLKEFPGRIYSMPVNMWAGTPENPGNAMFSVWLWIDDPDYFNKCWMDLELGSSNTNDADNYVWQYNPNNAGETNLKKGWNKLECDFANSKLEAGSRDDRHINYFRLVFEPEKNLSPKVGFHTYKIDDLRITKK